MKNLLPYLLFSLLALPVFAQENCRKEVARRNIVILPPTAGANVADRSLFKSLCARGYSVFILNYSQGSGLTTDLGIHDRLTLQFLTELNQFLSRESKPTVLIGSSLGGLYASVAFSLAQGASQFITTLPDLRWVDGVVITVAAGPLADVLARSELDSVQEQRALRLATGIYSSISDYADHLRSEIRLDPVGLAKPALAQRVLMFNSRNDVVVPTLQQEALWEAWGRPTVERVSTNHQLSIARVYFLMANKIEQFISGL